MSKWQCKVCGFIFLGKDPPEMCPACESNKDAFQRVDESTEIEEVEILGQKKKYKTVFRKGYTRKYGKSKKR